MKKPLFFTLFLFIAVAACKPGNDKNPDTEITPAQIAFRDYNLKIVTWQKNILNDLNNLSRILESNDTNLINPAYEQTLNTIRISIDSINQLPPLESDTNFRQSAKELFLFYRDIIDKEYRELVGLSLLGEANQTDAQVKRMEEINAYIQKGQDNLHYNFMTEQKKLADKYRMPLKSDAY